MIWSDDRSLGHDWEAYLLLSFVPPKDVTSLTKHTLGSRIDILMKGDCDKGEGRVRKSDDTVDKISTKIHTMMKDLF